MLKRKQYKCENTQWEKDWRKFKKYVKLRILSCKIIIYLNIWNQINISIALKIIIKMLQKILKWKNILLLIQIWQ